MKREGGYGCEFIRATAGEKGEEGGRKEIEVKNGTENEILILVWISFRFQFQLL